MKTIVKFVFSNTYSLLVYNSLKQRDALTATAVQFYLENIPQETRVNGSKWNTLSTAG